MLIAPSKVVAIKLFVLILLSSSLTFASDCTNALSHYEYDLFDDLRAGNTEAVWNWVVRNPKADLSKITDGYGRNILHWAAILGLDKLTRNLVSSDRINIYARDSTGYTALILAGMSGQRKVVGEILRVFSFNILTSDEFHTSYLLAIKYKHHRLAKIMSETPFGLHGLFEKLTRIMNTTTNLEKNYIFMDQIDLDTSGIKHKISKLQQKKIKFLHIVPNYYFNGNNLSFRSSTLRQTISIRLDEHTAMRLIGPILNDYEGINSLEEAMDILRTFHF